MWDIDAVTTARLMVVSTVYVAQPCGGFPSGPGARRGWGGARGRLRPGYVFFLLAPLAPAATATVEVTVTPRFEGTVWNVAYVWGSWTDPDRGNDRDLAVTPVQPAP